MSAATVYVRDRLIEELSLLKLIYRASPATLPIILQLVIAAFDIQHCLIQFLRHPHYCRLVISHPMPFI
jgi:hypothetical protein